MKQHSMLGIEAKCKKLIPTLHRQMHKGDCGRIGIFGGCEEYTGAPYYVAMTALKMGADLSHVFCEKDAAVVIKSYSPDLIVHPYLRNQENLFADIYDANKFSKIKQDIDLVSGIESQDAQILARINGAITKLHALSIGSGLGHDVHLHRIIGKVIKHAKNKQIPVVLDAEGLVVISNDFSMIHGHKEAILTPNVNELKRLCNSLEIIYSAGQMEKCAVECAKKLGGVTVVVKGEHDIITNGETVVYCSEQGGLKRCGGQGDVTSGAIATFLGWSVCYRQNRWRHENEISQEEIPILAAYAGCLVTRRASHLAYNEHGFSTQTSEILKHLNNARSFLAKY